MSTCYIPIVVSLLLKLLDELANIDKYFETYAHIYIIYIYHPLSRELLPM